MVIDFQGRLLGNVINYDNFHILNEYSIDDRCFTVEFAKIAYSAMKEIYEEGGSINIAFVGEKMRNMTSDWIDAVLYLEGFANDPSEYKDNTRQYAEIVREDFIRNEINVTISRLVSINNTSEQGKLIENISTLVDESMNRRKSGSVKTLTEIGGEYYKLIGKRIDNYRNGVKTGVTTGLDELDRYTTGWQDGNLIILAGRPGMGKTAMALHFAKSAAKVGNHVVMFSLEMGNTQLYERLMSSVSNINLSNMRSGNVNEMDVSDYNNAVGILTNLPIIVDDDPSKTTGEIKRTLLSLKKNGECDLAIIDYLQLLNVEKGGWKNATREQMISRATRELKIIAKEVCVPIIVLCQLSRAVESRASKEPMLSDLRESGSIEQDADIVLLVYRPEYYVTDGLFNGDESEGVLIIGKNREGSTGRVMFKHNKSLTQIS